MSLPIVHYNAPILRKKGEMVTVFDADLARLAADMVATMHEARGIGLAAQQVGLARQVCVLDLRETDRDFTYFLDGVTPPLDLIMPLVVVNPTLRVLPSDEYYLEEGCLSFPEIRGDVARPDAVEVSFQDVNGIAHTLRCDGLLARCLQHEIDHLNGTLFIDRMEKPARAQIDRAIKELARQTREAASLPPS